jgi:hypothetical protein
MASEDTLSIKFLWTFMIIRWKVLRKLKEEGDKKKEGGLIESCIDETEGDT